MIRVRRDSATRCSLLTAVFLLVLAVTACDSGAPAESPLGGGDSPTEDQPQGTDEADDTGTNDAASESVRLGFVGSLTGPLSASGLNSLRGFEAAVRYLEETEGAEFEILTRDSEGDPAQGAAVTRELIDAGVVGIYFTTEVFPAVQDLLNQSEVIGSSPGVGPLVGEMGDSREHQWAFSTGIGAGPIAVTPHVEYLQNELGADVVAQLAVSNGYGESQLALINGVSDDYDLEFVTEEFPPGATDVTSQLRRLRDSEAETLALWTYGTDLVTVMQNIQTLGWAPEAIVGPLGMGDPSVRESAPQEIMERAIAGPLPLTFLADTEGAAPEGLAGVFYERYMSADDAPDTFTGLDEVGAFAFDTVLMLHWAVEQAGSMDTNEIKAAIISGKPIEGAQGTYRFGPDERMGLSTDQVGLFEPAMSCASGTCVGAAN